VVAAGGGAALLASGGGSANGDSPSANSTTTFFVDQTINRFANRDFAVDVKGRGTLQARVDWKDDASLLSMSIVNMADPNTVLATGLQTGSKQTSLSIPVTPGTYRVTLGVVLDVRPYADLTYTLTVIHP
jgi:hypothetical protein